MSSTVLMQPRVPREIADHVGSDAPTPGDETRYVVFPLLAASLTRDPRAVALVSAAG